MMCKKLIYAISFVLVLSLAGNALAILWDGGGADDLWSTPENWVGDAVPTSTDRGDVASVPGATIANPGQECSGGLIGWSTYGNGDLTIDGGSLHVVRTTGTQFGWLALGHSSAVTGQLYMKSGYLLCDNKLQIGNNGGGGALNNLFMTGGTIELGEGSYQSGQGLRTDTNGHIQLDGGVITTLKLDMFGPGSMDIAGGTLIINGDVTTYIQGLIDSGAITANNGTSEPIMDYNVSNAGKTTLKGALECGDWGYLKGDINEDCYVDIDDLMELALNWLDY